MSVAFRIDYVKRYKALLIGTGHFYNRDTASCMPFVVLRAVSVRPADPIQLPFWANRCNPSNHPTGSAAHQAWDCRRSILIPCGHSRSIRATRHLRCGCPHLTSALACRCRSAGEKSGRGSRLTSPLADPKTRFTATQTSQAPGPSPVKPPRCT